MDSPIVEILEMLVKLVKLDTGLGELNFGLFLSLSLFSSLFYILSNPLADEHLFKTLLICLLTWLTECLSAATWVLYGFYCYGMEWSEKKLFSILLLGEFNLKSYFVFDLKYFYCYLLRMFRQYCFEFYKVSLIFY